jgi:phosphate uptake regulator
METRKIQLAGGTTYTVSLPKSWANEHDLEAGAPVEIDPHADGSLVIRTNGHRTADAAPRTIPTGDADPAALRRQIRAAYRTGADAVALTNDGGFDTDQQTAVRSTTRNLLGVDVVEQTDDRIVCKSLLDSSDVSVEQSLHQLQYVVLAAQRDAVARLRGGERHSIDDREAEATRLAALVARQFERALADPGELDGPSVTRSTLFGYYVAARQLARVAGCATTIVEVAGRRDDPLPRAAARTIDSTADEVRGLLEDATNALLDGTDRDASCVALADADALATDVLDRTLSDGSLAADAGVELAVVAHSLAGTADCAGAIADVALRAAVRADDS